MAACLLALPLLALSAAPDASAADRTGKAGKTVKPGKYGRHSASPLPARRSATAKGGQRAKAKQKKHATPDSGPAFPDVPQWPQVAEFASQVAAKHGFAPAELEALMRKVHFVEVAVRLVRPVPPGRAKDWRLYRARVVEPGRIAAGVRFWDEHAATLARAEQEYGVPAEIIAGILGVETQYGANTGKFRVMDAITTLAFAYPDTPNRAARMAFFRGELENTLRYAREEKIDPLSLRGSFAGAIGLPQFMPGSIIHYAVDYDGDNKTDLRGSPQDAIGSVANFLVRHGWQAGLPTVFPATVSPAAPPQASADPAAGGNVTGGQPTGGQSTGSQPTGGHAASGHTTSGHTTSGQAAASHAPAGQAAWWAMLHQPLEAKYTVEALRAAGVRPVKEAPPDLRYGLVDLENGAQETEFWLGTRNFYAITQYNRSFFYAMSVIELGRAVLEARENRHN